MTIRTVILDQFGKVAEVIVEGVIDAGITAGMMEPASEELVASRLAVCATCPQWEKGRCILCGCYTAQKVRLLNQKCPIGKWSTGADPSSPSDGAGATPS